MKRGGPLRRSDKTMAPGGLPAATKAQRQLFDKLLDQVGCAVCLFHLRIEGSQGCIHHIVEGGRRLSHWMVIPLCPIHHQGTEPGYICRHSDRGEDGGLAAFEEAYGTEQYLLQRCEEWINVQYSQYYNSEVLPDEQQAQSDCYSTNSNANLEPDTGNEAARSDEVETYDKAVCLDFCHYRYNLADPDGLSVKACIDGIVEAGLLTDDSAKEIESITHRQVKIKRSDTERTVITIEG